MWDRSQPTNPKYRSREHKTERKRWAAQMQTVGWLVCHQPICVKPTRTIMAGEPWHLGHDDTGTRFIGPTHAECNVRDAATRARQRQLKAAPIKSRWSL